MNKKKLSLFECFTLGYLTDEKDIELISKIGTNIHKQIISDEQKELEKILRNADTYKKRYEAIVNYVNQQLKNYNKRNGNSYQSTFNIATYNYFRTVANKIEYIDKKYPLEED